MGATAAEVTREVPSDRRFVGVVVPGEQGGGRHQDSRNTVPALGRPFVDERLLQRVQHTALGEPLECRDLAAIDPAERERVRIARALQAFFCQPFFVAAPFVGRPGVARSMAETLAGAQDVMRE